MAGEEKENGQRSPMTLNNVINMYKSATSDIFTKPRPESLVDFLFQIFDNFLPFHFSPYTQNGLKKRLEEHFGVSILEDVKSNPCVAAAVARQYDDNPSTPDILEIFDTRNKAQRYYSFVDVLLASSNAPLYFGKTPSTIGRKQYIDGGVEANCPLALALPRVLEIFGDTSNPAIETVISIAPPIEMKKENEVDANWFTEHNFFVILILNFIFLSSLYVYQFFDIDWWQRLSILRRYIVRSFKFFIIPMVVILLAMSPHMSNVKKWMTYFPTEMASGYSIFKAVQQKYNETIFVRVTPVSLEASNYGLDETNVTAMIQTIQSERLNEEAYFNVVLHAATLIILRGDILK